MHFAMPPRKTSRPPPFAAARNSSPSSALPRALNIHSLRALLYRNSRLRTILVSLFSFLAFVWILRWMGGSSSARSKSSVGDYNVQPDEVAKGNGAPVVIVTVFNDADGTKEKEKEGRGQEWVEKVKRNRESYAEKHGYTTFFTTAGKYPLKGSPASWAKVPALRHAMALHPSSTWFWYLDSTSLIANPSLPLTNILTPSRLESLMIVNEPVVPPDSVIKTFGNLKGDRIDLVISQDKEGLSIQSFVVRKGEWAKYFLDSWFDPIYRSYNFQKADCHALEHIVQWHGTLLAKLALVPQNVFNSYIQPSPSSQPHPKTGLFKDGELVAGYPGCERNRNCLEEMRPLLERLDALEQQGGQ